MQFPDDGPDSPRPAAARHTFRQVLDRITSGYYDRAEVLRAVAGIMLAKKEHTSLKE